MRSLPMPDTNGGCRADGLSGPARQVHQAMLAAFARTGQPPARSELERLARSHGASPDAVLAELAEADVMAFAAGGEIRAAYPFAPVRTPIRVSRADGPAAYAMCAIDALGMSAMLGRPVTITAAEPGTGRIITVRAEGRQARWHPRTAVVFAGSAGNACRPSADRSCGVHQLLRHRPGRTGLGPPPPRGHRHAAHPGRRAELRHRRVRRPAASRRARGDEPGVNGESGTGEAGAAGQQPWSSPGSSPGSAS